MGIPRSILLAFLALSACGSLLYATGEPNQTLVKVGVYVLNVGPFDMSTGSYTMDFYMDMRCDSPCQPGGFEFMNGRAITSDTLIDAPNEKFYRIQGLFWENIDLKNYPFDLHNLSVVIEDKTSTREKLAYIPDLNNSGVDPAITLVGWDLNGYGAKAEEHVYVPYGEVFSRFTYSISIKRIVLASLLKTFLPVVFIVLVGLLALLIRAHNKLWARVGIITSSLTAAVMFHINVTTSLPPVGYLTFADKFMILTYTSLFLCLLSSIILLVHARSRGKEFERKVFLCSIIGIPALTLLGYALLFLLV